VGTSLKRIERIYRSAGRTIWRYNSGTRPQGEQRAILLSLPLSLFLSFSFPLVIYLVISLALFFSRGSRLRRADRMTRMSAACGTMQRGRCAPVQWNRRYPGFLSSRVARALQLHPCRSLASFFIEFHPSVLVLSLFRASVIRSLFFVSFSHLPLSLSFSSASIAFSLSRKLVAYTRAN